MAEHKTLKGDRQFSTDAEKEVSQLNPILEEIIILVESAQKGDGMMEQGEILELGTFRQRQTAR